jgi:hypothetical protein
VYALVKGLIPEGGSAQIKNPTLGKLGLLVVGPTLATNLLSTGLIALRAWCALLVSDYRRLSLIMSPV